MISDSISAFVSTKVFDTYTMESALNDIIYLQNHAQSWSDIHYVTWGNWMDVRLGMGEDVRERIRWDACCVPINKRLGGVLKFQESW